MDGRLSDDSRCKETGLLMDKKEKAAHRKLRKRAIKLQNMSSVKLSMPDALRRVANEDSNPK